MQLNLLGKVFLGAAGVLVAGKVVEHMTVQSAPEPPMDASLKAQYWQLVMAGDYVGFCALVARSGGDANKCAECYNAFRQILAIQLA